MEDTKTELNEPRLRANITQNTKGMCFFEVTVRADTEQELKDMLDRAVNIASLKCIELNKGAE